MQQIKLILSDIDDTIMPKGAACVSERTRAAFHAALDAGLAIGPASGRGFAQIAPFFAGDTACCATAICTNGLEVWSAGERICQQLLPRESLEQLIDVLYHLPRAGLVCFDGAQPIICAGERDDLNEVFPAYARVAQLHDGLPDFSVLKANVFQVTDDAGTDELVALLNERVEGLDFDKPMVGYTNIMPSGWNKGAAVTYLAAHLGVSLDEVVVFGDAGNDLTMFNVVENAVAVANATPEAAAAARWHIGRCDEDAVAATIEQIVAGTWDPVA